MDNPKPSETKGVPWGDHNETESNPSDTRREEYGDADPQQNADERAAGAGQRSSDEENEPGREPESDSSRGESADQSQKPTYDV